MSTRQPLLSSSDEKKPPPPSTSVGPRVDAALAPQQQVLVPPLQRLPTPDFAAARSAHVPPRDSGDSAGGVDDAAAAAVVVALSPVSGGGDDSADSSGLGRSTPPDDSVAGPHSDSSDAEGMAPPLLRGVSGADDGAEGAGAGSGGFGDVGLGKPQRTVSAAEATRLAAEAARTAEAWRYGLHAAVLMLAQLALALVLTLAAPELYRLNHQTNTGARGFRPAFATAVIVQMLSLSSAVVANVRIAQRLVAHYVRPPALIAAYLSTTIAFGGVYWCGFIWSTKSFVIDGITSGAAHDRTDHFSVSLTFLYYSVATMTGTGFGDISPRVWWAEMFAACEMLLATAYFVGLFAIGVYQFQVHSVLTGVAHSRPRRSRIARFLGRYAACRWVWEVAVKRYLLLTVLCIQALAVLIVLGVRPPVHAAARDNRTLAVGLALTAFEIVQCTLVVLVSLRVVRKMSTRAIRLTFLVQSFLATIITFAGVYACVYVFRSTESWELQFARASDAEDVPLVLWRLLYFSTATMTTTGYGEVHAVSLVPRLFVAVEMLVSVLYAVCILGLGLNLYIEQRLRTGLHSPFGSAAAAGAAKPTATAAAAGAAAAADTYRQQPHAQRRGYAYGGGGSTAADVSPPHASDLHRVLSRESHALSAAAEPMCHPIDSAEAAADAGAAAAYADAANALAQLRAAAVAAEPHPQRG